MHRGQVSQIGKRGDVNLNVNLSSKAPLTNTKMEVCLWGIFIAIQSVSAD